MCLPSGEVAHPSEEELLHEVVQQIALVAMVQERAAHESPELREGRPETLRGARRATQDRERAEESLRRIVEVLEDRVEHVALRFDRSRVEAVRREELEGERVSAGRGDDPGHVVRFQGGPAGCEQLRGGLVVEAFEAEFEDASPRDVGRLEERRLRAARDEDLRIRRMFDDRSEEGVGGGARVEVVDRGDATRETLPEARDDTARLARGAGGGG